MLDEKPSHNRTIRGIYLLPNLFTMAALFAGFYAIVAATKQQFEAASIAIFMAILLDGLDGRIARLTQTESKFGAEFDSLSDMVCFGLSPALVLYYWSLHYLGKAGWLAAFLYTACTGLRLARFNSQDQNENKRFFQGLSTTAAAGFIAGFIWFATTIKMNPQEMRLVIVAVTVLIALLKVSFIKYRSFKDFDMRDHVPFIAIVALALLLVFISFDPPSVLFSIFTVYVISGPVMWVVTSIRAR